MRWLSFVIPASLLLVWVAFAVWQRESYRHERNLIEETLHQQSHSVMNALLGGIRSHRRLGHFFDVQLQGMLEELARSSDVLAVAVVSADGDLKLSAGEAELLRASTDRWLEAGDYWDAEGFRLVEEFRLAPADYSVHGGGSGSGRRRGPPWMDVESRGESPFSAGGVFVAVLVLDRGRADLLMRNAARLHLVVAVAGGLLLLCVAVLWRMSVRLVAAGGRARLLETEARHLREMNQAAAGLAHETRNPLGLIRGWTQRFVESNGDDTERQVHGRAVIEECDRVTARINQFLEFAKRKTASPELVDVRRLFDELAAILQLDCESKSVSLEQDIDGPHRPLLADRELLRQALFNLLQNAIQASPEGETVHLRLVPSKGHALRIEVADRGPGVPPDAVDSLFTPYFTTRADGTGLGLANVRRIAGLEGWEAGYVPREGGGSVFYLDGIHG